MLPLLVLQSPRPEVFVRYVQAYYPRMSVRIEPLVLYPGGIALRALPDGGTPSPAAESLRAALDGSESGRWSRAGRGLALTFGGKRETLAAHPTGGWYAPKEFRKETANYNVYFPVVPLTRATLPGRWTMRSTNYFGSLGGGSPTLAAGERGEATFRADGVFSQKGTSFVGATTSTMGAPYKPGGGDTTATASGASASSGTWRLQGPFLVTTAGGRTLYQIAFAMPRWGSKGKPDVVIGDDRWAKG